MEPRGLLSEARARCYLLAKHWRRCCTRVFRRAGKRELKYARIMMVHTGGVVVTDPRARRRRRRYSRFRRRRVRGSARRQLEEDDSTADRVARATPLPRGIRVCRWSVDVVTCTPVRRARAMACMSARAAEHDAIASVCFANVTRP